MPEAECSDSVTPSDELRQDLYDEPMDPETLKAATEGLAYGELFKFHPMLILLVELCYMFLTARLCPRSLEGIWYRHCHCLRWSVSHLWDSGHEVRDPQRM